MSNEESRSRFSGELDDDLADLIGVEHDDGTPDFTELFGEESHGEADLENIEAQDAFSTRGFTAPSQLQAEAHEHFNSKDYYKNVLTGEGEVSKKVHSLLSSFLNAKTSEDRSLYRGRLIPAYWDLLAGLARKINTLSIEKKLFLRFSVVLPTMIDAEQRDILSKVVPENKTGEPIYYVDEWLTLVARGRVNASATDETKAAARQSGQRLNAQLEKTRGKFQAQTALMRNHAEEMEILENALSGHAESLKETEVRDDLGRVRQPYDDGRKGSLTEIGNLTRKLATMNRELERQLRDLESLQEQLDELSAKDADSDEAEDTSYHVDAKMVVDELNTVRQMAKLVVGRQGNHFPLLLRQYYRGGMYDLGTRENVINTLIGIEYLDPGIFLRTFKQQTNRIVPNIVLLPCYGEFGVCWEPFERFNRAGSRGRLAVAMYPKDLRVAIIAAVGDLRWQVAKEKAQHYWMEEGLTGWYYQWFSDRKMKGDVKDAFISDYILWITKESEGTQKLDREVRGIFWRYLPFPQEVKDKLKNRGFVYQELYKKDQNRAMSDGY
ncbi:MAG: hypothetical protein LC641_03960 [Spirochaeta sp.]|nr:hypothetical protein [Spirochaeta sp.]